MVGGWSVPRCDHTASQQSATRVGREAPGPEEQELLGPTARSPTPSHSTPPCHRLHVAHQGGGGEEGDQQATPTHDVTSRPGSSPCVGVTHQGEGEERRGQEHRRRRRTRKEKRGEEGGEGGEERRREEKKEEKERKRGEREKEKRRREEKR